MFLQKGEIFGLLVVEIVAENKPEIAIGCASIFRAHIAGIWVDIEGNQSQWGLMGTQCLQPGATGGEQGRIPRRHCAQEDHPIIARPDLGVTGRQRRRTKAMWRDTAVEDGEGTLVRFTE